MNQISVKNVLILLAFLLLTKANAQAKEEVLKPYTGPSFHDVDPRTLTGKVMTGYQGWFNCEGDGAGLGWTHWSRRRDELFAPGNVTVDLWPDESAYDADELFTTGFTYGDGTPARVFSSHNRKTVLRHFRWMAEYGIDGAFIQRFTSRIEDETIRYHKDKVLSSAREGANRYGRTYAVMYDITSTPDDKLDTVFNDWLMLRKKMHITEDAAYQHHNGKPLVAIWGVGFNDNIKPRAGIDVSIELIRKFKDNGCSIMLGTATGWRMRDRDALDDPRLHEMLLLADVISPWTVGRYNDLEGVERHVEKYWSPDIEWCREQEVDYLPVVYPGFSWHNNKGGGLGRIPRLKGQFFWSQIVANVKAGTDMLYIAMFDEVDEGTAIFKCTNNPPNSGETKFLTLEGLPTDYYLQLAGAAGKLLRNEIPATESPPAVANIPAKPYFGNGIKIGETTAHSTVVWARLTNQAHPNWDGLKWLGTDDRDFDVGEFGGNQFPEGALMADMEGSLPGMKGKVRFSWWPDGKPKDKQQSAWLTVDPDSDYTRQFEIRVLKPAQQYMLKVESKSVGGKSGQSLTGTFKTAPAESEEVPLQFVVSTCQSWITRDNGTEGDQIYEHMLDLHPDFFVHLGDIVYYDKRSAGGDVDARTPELARFHWNRWYGCSDIIKFHQQVPSFFIKDDHDTVTNDSVPGTDVGTLTWDRGLSIFREQVPIGEKTYRSRRWGKDLQFWIVEGRDYRSPNKMPDGADKSIWGPEQKAWFMKEVLASDAPFKILFTPTPVVGPDRENKKDNYANSNWTYEGDEIRKFCAENNVIVVCGDRHWQYHSIDDRTGVHEFSCGAGTDAHAGGFSMDLRTPEHQYLAIIGGFLSAEISPKKDRTELTFRHHRVDGSVAYEYTFSR